MSLADAAPFAVAAWTLDEASGTRADQVGANDLTDNNTVGSATGQFSNAADFELANSESLSIADNADLSSGTAKILFRCWIKPESHTANGFIASKWDGTPKEWFLYLRTTGIVAFGVSANGTSYSTEVAASTFGALSDGTWYLVCGWHDPDGDVIGVSVNGTANTASYSSGLQDTTATFYLGNEGELNRYFDGLIDDAVFLKGYILSADERTEDYNSGTGVAFADWAASGTTYNETGSGGAVASGLATVNCVYSPSPAGGAAGSGTAGLQTTYNVIASGGAVCGGSAVVQLTCSVAAAGGAVSGGVAGVQATYNPTVAGGAVCGGEATLEGQTFNETGSGGAVSGGAAGVQSVYNTLGLGGAGCDGAALVGCEYFETPAGGAVCGGAATVATPSGVSGPYRVAACEAFVPGAAAGQVHVPGGFRAEEFTGPAAVQSG